MALAEFETLCTALTEVAGASRARIAVAESGAAAMSVKLLDVEVTIAHDPQRGEDSLFVLTRFGALPELHAEAAARALLRTNSLMLRSGSPHFGCDPDTGDVTLMHTTRLSGVPAHDLYRMIVSFAEIARSWRGNYFLDAPPTLPSFAPLS